MAYCTVADVENEMGQKFSQSTRPTTDTVETVIDGVSSEIDGVLQAIGYPLPVTNTSALALLKRYAKFGASAEAWHSGYISDDEPARVAYWRETYSDFIGRLRRAEQELPGEVSEGGPSTGFSVSTKRVDGYTGRTPGHEYA